LELTLNLKFLSKFVKHDLLKIRPDMSHIPVCC